VARRKYDTTALIQDLKTDRRRGIGLTLAAILIIAVLFGLYVSQIGGGAPEVPGVATPTPASPEERAQALKDAVTPDEPEESPAEAAADPVEEPAPPPAKVEVLLPRKAALTIDDEAIGKVKSHELELEPGKHTFTMKLGKRSVTHEEEIAAGTTVQITFKRRKAVSKVTQPEKPSAPDAE